MKAMYLANYFVAGCIASCLLGWTSEFASDGIQGDCVFGSNSRRCLGLLLAARFFY